MGNGTLLGTGCVTSLLPVLLTAATFFPLSSWMFQRAVKTIQQEHAGDKPICTPDTPMNIWCAAKSGDLEMVKKYLAEETDKVNTLDPLRGVIPLTWAVIASNINVATSVSCAARVQNVFLWEFFIDTHICHR